MTTRQLQKWHGAGNDFLVDLSSDATAWWTNGAASDVCDRHLGVGADGVLAVTPTADGVDMVLYNADGSRAEMSGNGIRCAAAAAFRQAAASGPHLRVHTDAGDRVVTLELRGDDGYGEVSMGRVILGENVEGATGVASVGNPHAVVFDDPSWGVRDREIMAGVLSAALGGANVEFATVSSRDSVTICVVERGVGWTLACGTGSVATVAVLRELGLVDDVVEVANPGGTLRVTLDGDNATLAGPVHFVADVTWTVT